MAFWLGLTDLNLYIDKLINEYVGKVIKKGNKMEKQN